MKRHNKLKPLISLLLLLLLSCDLEPSYSYSLNGNEIAVYSNTSFLYDGEWVKFAQGEPPLELYSENGQSVWIHRTGEIVYKSNISKGTTLIK